MIQAIDIFYFTVMAICLAPAAAVFIPSRDE